MSFNSLGRRKSLKSKKKVVGFKRQCFFFNGELTGRKFFENFDKSPVPRIFDGELTGKKIFPVDPLKKKKNTELAFFGFLFVRFLKKK